MIVTVSLPLAIVVMLLTGFEIKDFLKLLCVERVLSAITTDSLTFATRGNMELFPISSGGGQFTFVPLTLWYKFATRGCRWICYSNCKQTRSKVQTSIEFLFALDWRIQTRIQLRFGLYFAGEILAQPSPREGVVFFTQGSFKFVRYLLLTST